jgi:hypothetical protein
MILGGLALELWALMFDALVVWKLITSLYYLDVFLLFKESIGYIFMTFFGWG